MTIELKSFSPKQIVSELDRYIIGQDDAKRVVAVALRNRWRRQQIPSPLKEEVLPKNILMIGPTGVGKTEIARRLAKLSSAPFIKVEATKFTEVGYVGRDVEQIIRDLIEVAIAETRSNFRKIVKEKAELAGEERILDALVGKTASDDTKQVYRKKYREGLLDDKEIEIEVEEQSSAAMPNFDVPGMPGAQMGFLNINDLLGKAIGGNRKKKKTLSVKKATEIVVQEESDRLLDNDTLIKKSIELVEQNGIVFIDEIDKICAKHERGSSDVSREGVQRDLLPLIEGTNVSTKYGPIKTDHILFIASGAFHLSKPSDLLPELQGRLPTRVELQALSENDFKRILLEPEASLIKQYKALLKTENVDLVFEEEAIDEIAQLTVEVNRDVENIGARRLHTVLERLLEDISFSASEKSGNQYIVNKALVEEKVSCLRSKADLSRFIL